MKKTKLLAAGLVAAAAAAVLAPSARAQNTVNTGDLFIGFEEPGVSYDYVIDLGPANYFIGLAATPGTTDITTADPNHGGGLGLGNIASDLSNVFGANWATNSLVTGSNVQWGVIGATSNSAGGLTGAGGTFGLPKNTLFETSAELTPGTQSSPLPTNTSGVQGTVNTNIIGFESNFNNSTQTANSNYAEIQTVDATNDPDSWTGENPSAEAFGNSYSIEQPTSGAFIGPTNSVLDLYELKPQNGGTGVDLGSFSLTSAGDLDFTSAAAVPEPSTYAAIGIGAAFLVLFRRNRKRIPV